MLFNSFSFGLFLPIAFLVYWAVGRQHIKRQNLVLLVASYIFYGMWDWRFLSLIFASSLVDFYVGIYLPKAKDQFRKNSILAFSVLWNLGVLFLFKYYNFFIAGFSELFALNTEDYVFSSLRVILPVGLSFYTFQTLSYSIDVYRGRFKPSTNLLNFLGFVSFFPQVVAGPIERARNLLPQFDKERKFDLELAKDGLRQILWGLFKKVVVADNAAVVVNTIYASPEDHGSLSLLYASALFFFQIYCDFAGYSDIAIGTARLFGFRLSKNFNIPYLSRSVAEFWQRWHITLTKWFTDYVYGPLAKNSKNYVVRTGALFVSMGLIGLWHGANWTFIVFGLFQALTISIERIPVKIKGKVVNINYYLTKMPLGLTVIYSFALIMTSCIFFRAENLDTAFYIIGRILQGVPSEPFSFEIGYRVLFIPLLILMEYFTRNQDHPFVKLEAKTGRVARWAVYYLFIFFILRYAGPKEEFIYFQF